MEYRKKNGIKCKEKNYQKRFFYLNKKNLNLIFIFISFFIKNFSIFFFISII
jgi:hypothetical protein